MFLYLLLLLKLFISLGELQAISCLLQEKFVQWLIFESMLKITVFGSVQIVKIRG